MAEIQVAQEAKSPVFLKADAIKAKAEENKKLRALPPKPGENVGFKDLKNWLALLTPEMTEDNRIIIYVYRHDPVIIRQNVDPDADNNIDVISDGFNELSEQYFIDTHGGGKYGLVVKDQDNPKQGKNGFFTATLTIPTSQYPPNLDLREVDWTHKNNKGFRAWCRAKKLIDDNNVPIEQSKANLSPQQQQGNQDSMMVPMFKMMMDFVDKMSQKDQANLRKQLGAEDSLGKSVGELLLEKMKQDDPNKQITTLTTLLAAMRGNEKGSELATIMPMFMTMMQTMMESNKQQTQMLISIMQASKSEDKGEGKDEVSRLRDLIEVARELRGGNSGGGGKHIVSEIIEAAAPILTPLLNFGSNIIALKASANNPNIKPQHVTPDTTNPTQQTDMSQSQPQQPQLPNANEAAQIINNFKGIILNKLAGEGWEFGVWIEDGFGPMQAAAITKYGVEGLVSAAKMVPDFWQQIEATYGELHLRKWLDSFVRYKEIVEEMEKSEEEEEKE